MTTIRIGNGAGFLGDWLDAPRLLAEGGTLDYLTLEYLAELTMSILARVREKDSNAGYADDFIAVLHDLVPCLKQQPRLKIVTNGGGMNPVSCARAAAGALLKAGLGDVAIGVVTGDDLLPRLAELQHAGCEFKHFDAGAPLSSLKAPVVSANAYLGAKPIADALAGGARIVITGRVADASLTVGPAAHEFGWQWDDYRRLAGASVAGHIIECGAQATGGYQHAWQGRDLTNVGYPIAAVDAAGSCLITKPPGTGGMVTRQTVALQLVYEIGDPQHYLTPDVDVDFTTVEVKELPNDRVLVTGAAGAPPPGTLKVSLAYRDGFTASGQLLVEGKDCVPKAKHCAEMIRKRLSQADCTFARWHVELLGAGDGVPGLGPPPSDLRELMLRITVASPDRQRVERFTKEFAPLITSGPAGLAGYAAGRPSVRPVFAYWPSTIPRELVTPQVEIRKASDW